MIIAFGHRKYSGKDTAAKLLETLIRCENRNVKVVKISFASKLKDVAWQLYWWAGLQQEIFYEAHPEFKEVILPKLGKTPREIWIELGNKMREIYPATWIDFALHGIKADIVIITDLRYLNETEAIHKQKGICIKIEAQERLTANGIKPGTDVADTALADWTGWNYIVDNNGTMQELGTRIDSLAKLIGVIS